MVKVQNLAGHLVRFSVRREPERLGPDGERPFDHRFLHAVEHERVVYPAEAALRVGKRCARIAAPRAAHNRVAERRPMVNGHSAVVQFGDGAPKSSFIASVTPETRMYDDGCAEGPMQRVVAKS